MVCQFPQNGDARGIPHFRTHLKNGDVFDHLGKNHHIDLARRTELLSRRYSLTQRNHTHTMNMELFKTSPPGHVPW